MKTFDAKITLPDGQTKILPSVTIYKGVIAQVVQKGVGIPVEKGAIGPGGDGETWEEYPSYVDAYKSFFNSKLIEEYGIEKEEVKKAIEESRDFDDEKYLKCMFIMGQNPHGYFVEDKADVDQKKLEFEQHQILQGEVPVNFVVSPYGLGLTIDKRLPKHLWDKIAKHATYCKASEDDMEFLDDQGYIGLSPREVRGWYYANEAMQVLIDEGIQIKYRGKDIKNILEVNAIDVLLEGDKEQYHQLVREINEKADVYKKLLSSLATKYGGGSAIYATEEEANKVSQLPRVLIPYLGWTGPDIYGNGKWLHIKGDDLYLVYNNGMDGDDWSRNNYGTGGAGAICWKAEGEAATVKKLQQWIDSLGQNAVLIKN